ncbi:hypothetical protein LAZ67_10002211 [Cordylochernes scorpioides]|uniref:Endonuclease n=1 Tax=Cordylochernes scorpioides TaxID=51811 RepID=A0ABY6KX61_9ARAC|nr:hypothetical protein LAZ67_10002211 [Cordylochernes scorpioides]
MAEEIILRLKKKRAVNRSYLTKTCNKIESGLDTLMRIELEELLEQLNESFNELKLVDHEIETLLETDDLEKELQGVEEYREKYITWRFRANKKIRQSDFHGENIPNSNSRIDENEMRHYVPSCTTVKLPKLMISKFYGNFSEWLTFWNSFDAAIHQNNSLNPIDKFNYLKSHLGGTALNTVEGFALSADNYEKAIKLLKDRFGREDILISRHMNNLLSMRPLKTSSDVRTFRELFDNLSVHIRSLESLNVSIDVYGQLLCPIIIKLLPADLNLELNKELPTGYVINDLITFLERQLTAREKSFRNEIGTGNESTSKPNLVNKHPKTRFYNEKPIATASELLNSVHKSNECVFCGKDNHGSPKCDFAANISLNEKRSLMKKKGVCYKCLRPSHLSKFCRNVVRCSICNMSSHLDVMCTKLILDRGGSSKSPTVQDETLANLSTSPDVLLPTLRVTLKGNRTEKTARAIIDTGSQRSYILHSTAMEMEYEQSRREFFRHSLFGGSSTDVVEHEVYTIHLSDINNSYRCEFEALGQPLICGSIPPVCPRSLLEGSEELDVSDLMRGRIEVLIGADIAGRLLTDDQRRISSGLVAIRTKLGWTVMGKIPPTEVRDDISSLCVTTLLSLDLENLWKLDAIGVSDAEVEKKTQSLQAEMEEHFAHTTTRDIEGRYEVALPWVQDKERIPSNKDLAENQLRSVRRKLEEVGDMKEYGQIFEEWMKQGIIEYAREDKLDGVHYLPHRPVYKRNSQTSRIRPVFNASARKRGKLSLNDCLDKGPNLIEIIPRLLNKFRKYEVGVSSDMEKAFLQIGIKEEDRDYLRFLWHTEDGRLITYRHKRVVFGITTSPYLLKATLSLHLDKAPEHLKITAEQLNSSFYVDNCLSSFQNVEETEKFVKESTELLSTACFNLRDWVSNVTDFSLMNQLNKEVNILGITWNTDRDTLTIGLEDFELIGPTTKRKVLSTASKIFDPLGVACPVTLIPKLILQETWIQKLTWDEVLPGRLVQRFWKWFSKLKHLPNIEIPRWLCFKDSYVEKTTLHIFCDASQFAYATCIFLRIEKEDRVDIQLIQARTRVAPLKKLTIPRLELLACLIGARLAANVIQDLEFEEIPRFYWTDSTNALCWIQREDNWAAFVMNRVKEIHNLSSPESWRHIPGRLNPADLPSRGCSAESLKETRWWEGPAWLKVSQEEWPKSTIIPDLEIVYSERRKTILNTLCTTRENENLFGRYSHFLRIVRITAWIYRFFNNAKIDRRKITSEDLSTEEITKSEIILIRLIQRESFSGHEDKKLQGFKLLVDSSGILRIKTKICRREDFANFRMPILLPSDHFLVSLLIRWNHETHGHAGLQTLLGILRENYWILRSRKTVKKIINQCIRCKRFTATPATVESTSLPEDRVRDAAVFEIVGVDLTGHLILKNKKKAWIVIFTCAVYRGVHLELVTSLSMEAFLQAFRRFIARRGRPLIVYSDNGTNFKGMANALKKIDFSRLKCDPTLKNITWKFIPPGAPWWGGWWERLIGMMKQLLFRILGQTSLGYEELSTVMRDVESLMNTRPLTYLTEESEDLAPLTPSLFLHEVREVGVPDLDLIDNQTLSRKYQYIKRVREDLRERFRIEYFGFLRQETRRLKTTIPLKVGDMVLIGQESLKRLHWPLARIIQLYPGKDGLVRVAKVKTSSGDKIRPIQKLYNLEITPEIRCRDPLTERSPTQEVRLTTEEDPLTSQQEQHHIDTPNVVSSYGRPIKRPNRLDLLNFSFPCLSRRDANSKCYKQRRLNFEPSTPPTKNRVMIFHKCINTLEYLDHTDKGQQPETPHRTGNKNILKTHNYTHTSVYPFKCDHCEYRTANSTNLSNHLRTHNGEKPFKCDHCDYRTGNKSSLKTHNYTHTSVYPFKCDHCDYRTATKARFTSHVLTHTGEKPFECDLCGFKTAIKRSLKRHLSLHSGEKPFKCDHCEYRTANSTNLSNHLRTHTGKKPFKCDHCDYRTGNKGSLKTHNFAHTSVYPFKCDHCDYRTATKARFTSHVLTHTGEKPFECDLCDYRATEKILLKLHLLSHTGEKPFKCDFCDYRAKRKVHLTRHLRTHTGEKPFKCDYCDYRAIQKNLTIHLSKHTGVKPFKCDHCDFTTASKKSLEYHNYIHTGNKPFKCDNCDFSTPYKRLLKLHNYKHTGNEPFKCDHCDYKTGNKTNLKVHLMIHTGEKPFKCDLCDFRTAYRNYLTKHLISHTGDRPFKCDYSALEKNSLTAHLSKHTSEKPFKCDHCDFRTEYKKLLEFHNYAHTSV